MPYSAVRSLSAIVALLTLLLVGLGCKQGPEIVGLWDTTIQSYPATIEFKEDGSFVSKADAGLVKVSSKGTYKLEGEQLTMTGTDVKLEGMELPESQRKAITSRLNQAQTTKIIWSGQDAFRFEQGNQTIAFTRRKNQSAPPKPQPKSTG